MKASHIIAALCGAVILGNAPGIVTEASAAPVCEHRGSAHIEKHGGLAKDSAEHVARGELPTCDPNPQAQKSAPKHDEQKSRLCRKKWYC